MTTDNLPFIDFNAKQGVMIINGQTVDLFNLKPADMTPSKIVKGLQGVIRFNGYSGWSVAQHSFMLSHLVENVVAVLIDKITELRESGIFNAADSQHLFRKMFGDELTEKLENAQDGTMVKRLIFLTAYDALIHDFTESLTGDIIRPFKQLVPEINAMEERIDGQIRAYYKALDKMPPIVNVLDKQLATIEAYYLTRYDNKTLINENDEFQLKSFNGVFNRQHQDRLFSFVATNAFGIEMDNLATSLPDSRLFKVLDVAGITFNEIKAMGNDELLVQYIQRLERLRAYIQFQA